MLQKSGYDTIQQVVAVLPFGICKEGVDAYEVIGLDCFMQLNDKRL